jgi:diacylglycerol kinase (ATP)
MTVLKKKMMLIINPVAGKQEARKNLSEIVQIFTAAGYMVTVFITGKERGRLGIRGEIRCQLRYHRLLRRRRHHERDRHGHHPRRACRARGLHALRQLQRLCGISGAFQRTWSRAAKDIVKGSPAPCGRRQLQRQRYFINAADFGAFTWLPYTTPQQTKNTLGAYAYLLEGIKDISKVHSQHLKLYANGGVYEGDYLFGIICNATMLAGVLSRKGRIIQSDDGIFEVGMVRMPESALDFQEILQALRMEDLGDPHITFFKTNRLTIESDGTVDWSLDGERERAGESVELEDLHSRITLIC